MEDFVKTAAFQAIDRGHIGNRPGNLQDAVLGQIAEPAELRSAIERAQQTCKNLHDLRENFERHLDRILGARPETGDEACHAVNRAANGEMASLRDVLSDLDDVAYRIRNQVERLARL